MIGVHSAKFPSEHATGAIRQAVLRLGIEHPVVNDTDFRIWNEYNVRAWPTLILIDPNGRIVGETAGEIQAEDMAGEIAEVINANRDALDATPLKLEGEAEREPERVLEYPSKLLLAPGGVLFVADSGHHRILQLQLDPEGVGAEVTRVFGGGKPGLVDGLAAEAQFNHPHGMALNGNAQEGTLYVADTENHAIRAIDLLNGDVRTVAGTGQKAHGQFALGRPTETPLRSPSAVAAFEQYLFIAMAGSHQIWVLINEDQIGPFAGTGAEALVDGPVSKAAFNQPSDLALGMGHLFVADAEASAIRAITLDQTPGTITLVGQGLFEYGDVDGEGEAVRLQHPEGIALEENLLYVADTYNHKIKLLDPTTGRITTLVGSGQPGHNDGAFLSAELFEPEGVQISGSKIYIADTNNHLIRTADLDAREVKTLSLRGLDQLRPVTPKEAEPQRLQPVEVAPGEARVVLDVRLPPGYKRNPDALSRVSVQEDGGMQPYRFEAGEPVSFPVHARESGELPLEITLYYCEDTNLGVCLIHDRKAVLPVTVKEGAPKNVKVDYPIEEKL